MQNQHPINKMHYLYNFKALNKYSALQFQEVDSKCIVVAEEVKILKTTSPSGGPSVAPKNLQIGKYIGLKFFQLFTHMRFGI